MTLKHLMALGIGALCATAHAQLNSSVSVEGEYEPLVIETERLNTFPSAFRFELPPSTLNFDYTGIVADFRPSLLTMGATARNAAWPWTKRRGYADVRLGSYLHSGVDAGYYILADGRNTLLADLQFESSSLFRTKGVPESYGRMPLKRLYDGTAGLHYTRLEGAEGILKAHASYRAAYFNYYGTVHPLAEDGTRMEAGVPTQTLNGVKAGVEYSSSPSTIRGWHAGAGVEYLGYRRLYGQYGTPAQKGDRQTELDVSGGYAYTIAGHSALAIDADARFLFLEKPDESAWLKVPGRRNYGVVSLKPAYRMATDALAMNAGVELAFSYDAMGSREGKRFAPVHVAPDVSLAYNSGAGFGLSLEATGGVTPATLALTEQFDRYQMPFQVSTQPIYTPVDAKLAFNVGPFAGFTAVASLRYAVARNVPAGGWYQVLLGAYLPRAAAFDPQSWLDPWSRRMNLHGMSASVELGYSLGTLLEAAFEGTYTPQKGTTGIFNGFDRPRWTLEARAAVRPVKPLTVELGYRYRGVRNCYFPAADGTAWEACRLPDITDLNARVAYRITDCLEVYCKGENLLNRHVDILPGLQGEGICIQGGFYVEF